MTDLDAFTIELQELATRYTRIPQNVRDGLEQLIDTCLQQGGEPHVQRQ